MASLRECFGHSDGQVVQRQRQLSNPGFHDLQHSSGELGDSLAGYDHRLVERLREVNENPLSNIDSEGAAADVLTSVKGVYLNRLVQEVVCVM